MDNHSIPIVTIFDRNARRILFFQNAENSADELKRLRAQWIADFEQYLQAARSECVVISGENIPLIDEDGVGALHSFLARFFDDIQVVAYIRGPRAFYSSAFQQRLRSILVSLDSRALWPNYWSRFEKFDNVFGRENVSLWRFDPEQLKNRCVVTDFCLRLGIELPAADIMRENESLSREATGLLYAYRKFGSGNDLGRVPALDHDVFINSLKGISGSKFRLSAEQFRPILEANCGDLTWMEERLGQKLSEDLADDEGVIHSEDDLLRVDGKTCERFVEIFESVTGVRVRPRLPASLETDPRSVANLIERCRQAYKDEDGLQRNAKKTKGAAMPSAPDEIGQIGFTEPLDSARRGSGFAGSAVWRGVAGGWRRLGSWTRKICPNGWWVRNR